MASPLSSLANTRRRRPRPTGVLITFEGIEGSGKTTQSLRLIKRLRAEGYPVVETREPGGTPFAEHIRTILLKQAFPGSRHQPLTPECEAALVFAARAHHTTYKIRPELSQGKIVVCDRFSDSTLAYQGFGRKLAIERLQLFNDFATGGLTPDLTFLLDVPVRDGLTRRRQGGSQNAFDRESLGFHGRVRRGFLELARQNPNRIVRLNGRRQPDTIARDILAATRQALASRSTRNHRQRQDHRKPRNN